jgi:phosphonoacetaldehyde hydrolase
MILMRRSENDNKGKTIRAVIFDWAGTTVDYGCIAPLDAFVKAFDGENIDITFDEARAPMGKQKIDHLRELFAMERISMQWRLFHGKDWTEDDVKRVYARFEPILFSTLDNFSAPVCGLDATLSYLKDRKIPIGSTTGYTRKMMDVVAPAAASMGYAPHCIVTSDEVAAGRPAPWMCFRALEKLGVYPARDCVKIGDTVADIAEGVNAGMTSVGVVFGGSVLGLTEEEADLLKGHLWVEAVDRAVNTFMNAGADYVIESIASVPELIEHLEGR